MQPGAPPGAPGGLKGLPLYAAPSVSPFVDIKDFNINMGSEAKPDRFLIRGALNPWAHPFIPSAGNGDEAGSEVRKATRAMCSIHEKERSLDCLTDVGGDRWVCIPGKECRISREDKVQHTGADDRWADREELRKDVLYWKHLAKLRKQQRREAFSILGSGGVELGEKLATAQEELAVEKKELAAEKKAFAVEKTALMREAKQRRRQIWEQVSERAKEGLRSAVRNMQPHDEELHVLEALGRNFKNIIEEMDSLGKASVEEEIDNHQHEIILDILD